MALVDSNTYIEPTAGTSLSTARLQQNQSYRSLLTNFSSDGPPVGVNMLASGEALSVSGTGSDVDGMLYHRSNANGSILYVSSKTFTWRLETIDTSSNTASTPSGTFGTQSGAGPTNRSMATYDFTSSIDAGSNAIAAGDTVQISVQADSDAGGNIKYYVTCLWEWDLS